MYKERREELFKRIEGNFALIIFAGEAIGKSEDETYPFSVNRNFYYLSGLENEANILLLSRTDGKESESLFILPYDEVMARWVGGRMSKEDASGISGIERVFDVNEFTDQLSRLLNLNRKDRGFKIYLDLWHYSFDQLPTPATRLADKLRQNYPAVNLVDCYELLASLRLVKDEEEIRNIQTAIAITRAGIEKMMKTIRPGMNEMVMEGVFNFVLMQNLCNQNAFHTIAASGARACTLHYGDNNQTMQDGELFLCDLGATYKHYCADISRTFPVNGKFTARQKELYQLVLNAQKLVAEKARPGMTTRDLNDLVVSYYEEELPKHGLTKGVSEYYFHGVSHHLGLDTHDIDGGVGRILKPGNIITNEPGLYVADEGIGIRIEDDLLITEDGAIVLSKDIVKEVEDIEALMARR